MKRIMKVFAIFVVFVVLLAACTGSVSQIVTGQEKDSKNENIDVSKGQEPVKDNEAASQDQDSESDNVGVQNQAETILPGSSEEITEDSESENHKEQESSSAAQEDGIQQDGTYINHQYGFSINIPEHWMEHLVIETGYWAEETDYSVDFYYVAYPNVKESLFSIVIYDQVIEESQWDNPIWSYIGTNNGKTYASAIPGEPSETILEEKNKEHFETVKIMINEELLGVLDTFQFIDS